MANIMLRKLTNQYYYKIPLLFCIVVLSACATKKTNLLTPYQPLSSLQRASMQCKELQGNFETVFTATISVLQDEGWQIDVVDKTSGIIQARSLKKQYNIGPAEDWYLAKDPEYYEKLIKIEEKKGFKHLEWTRWQQLTSHIEPWGNKTVRQRITITKVGSVPSNTYSFLDKKKQQKTTTIGAKEQSVVVENPTIYQHLFQMIQRAVFIRQGLTN